MAEIPEHLLKRSAERRKALGLPDRGEGGEEPSAQEPGTEEPGTQEPEPAAETPQADEGGGTDDADGDGETSKIPKHLLERSRRRRDALAGGDGGDAPAAASAGAGGTATATVAAPSGTGPGGHTQRLLTVVKAGSIQQTRAEAVDKVHVWPHLLVIEFAATLIVLAYTTIFSALVRAPLLTLADTNRTPNPSKAPWYFLGLQELLTMFHPMVAGVTIPGIGLGLLMLAPYVDKNPSHRPEDRKFAISIFTLFLMLWAVLVIIGSFFRGPGFNFTFPWNDGVFFEL
jgi:menaquinol-cytochrome c reductase cytochrome b/c subunit